MDPQITEARPRRPRFLHLLAPYRIVAYLEIASGIIGLHLCLVQLVKNGLDQLTTVTGAVFVVFGLLFCLAIVAGTRLLKQDRAGYILSIIIQSLQIPFLYSDILIYKITTLVRFVIFMRYTTAGDINLFFGYDFNVLEVGFQFFFGKNTNEIIFGINLIPILFIAIIYTNWSQKRRTPPSPTPNHQRDL